MLQLWGVTVSGAEVIAGLSLALSVLVLRLRHRDAGRAYFTAEWSGSEAVRVLNHGPGSARAVRVRVESSSPHNVAEANTWPIVGPRQPVTVGVIRTLAVEHGPVEISWRDNRWREQHLSIPLGDPPTSRPRPRLSSSGQIEDAISRLVVDEIEGHLAWMRRHRLGPFRNT